MAGVERIWFSVLVVVLFTFSPRPVSCENRFSQLTYTFTVSEDTPVKTSIGQVVLTDASGKELAVSAARYSISARGVLRSVGLFTVREDGHVVIAAALDRESLEQHEYSLVGKYITRAHNVWQRADCTIVVNLLDVNDSPPKFENDVRTVGILEGEQVDRAVADMVVSDADLGTNGDISFAILQASVPNTFYMDSSEGLVLTSAALDRETIAQYNITIRATDHGTPALHSDLLLIVDVLDINDHAPEFNQTTYNASVHEDIASGTAILQIFATDLDTGTNSKLAYRFASGNYDDALKIDPQTGMITVAKSLDYDTLQDGDAYQVQVQAVDGGGLSAMATVIVTVMNANDHSPVFDQDGYTFFVTETDTPLAPVGKVYATDLDRGLFGSVVYDLPNVRDHAYFQRTSSDGILRAAAPLDHELRPRHTMTVRALDKGSPPRTALTNVTIIVNDINDVVPAFQQRSYEASISEDTARNRLVTTVEAVDVDGLPLRYVIASGNIGSVFSINSADGSIRVAKSLDADRPGGDQYNLVVTAHDGQHASNVNVTVAVQDINDNSPSFQPTYYEAKVREGDRVGTPVLTVTARDLDSADNGRVTYSLQSTDTTLQVDPDTGQVYIAAPADCDRGKGIIQYYTLWAHDNGVSSRNDSARLQLTITDINDNAPVFVGLPYNAQVFENLVRRTRVFTVLTSDDDYSINNRGVRFSLNQSAANSFRIEHLTGVVRTTRTLDRETRDRYRILVYARDTGTPALTSELYVDIEVLDVPDNSPRFTAIASARPPANSSACYQTYIVENMPAGTHIMTVHATVPDISVEQSSIRYRLMSVSPDELFHLNSSTGELTSGAVLDRDKGQLFYTARVDAYTDFVSGSCEIIIRVRDVNDNPPQVRDTDVVANLLRSSFQGGVIGQVRIIDPDISLVVQTPLSSPGFDSGFFTLARDGSIAATRSVLPGVYKLRSSADDQNAAHSRAEGTTTVHVRWISDTSLQHSVSMQVSGSRDLADFVQHYLLRTSAAIERLLTTMPGSVEIFTVRETTGALGDGAVDLIFAVRSRSGAYMGPGIVIESIDVQQVMFYQHSGLRINFINLDTCRTEPCNYFQDCLDSVRFTGENTTIVAGNTSFTSLLSKRSFSCTCPLGYQHTWHSNSCQREVDECASSPCKYGGSCIDMLSGYKCLCLANTTGPACETFCPSASCDFCEPNPCMNGGTCTTTSRGEVQCVCKDGFDGPQCQMTLASFLEGDYVAFPSLTSRWQLKLSLSFVTARSNGLLLYNGRLGTQYDFLALELINGRLQCQISLGNGPVKFTTLNTRVLSDAKWHTVTLELKDLAVKMRVDGCYHEHKSASFLDDFICQEIRNITEEVNIDRKRFRMGRSLDLGGPLYIGGLRSAFNSELSNQHFVGCIRDIVVNEQYLDFSSSIDQSAGVTLSACPPLSSQFCDGAVCGNNGVCQNVWNTSYCGCMPDFGGKQCEHAKVYKAKFTGQSFIQYYLSQQFFRGRRGLTFRTRQANSTLWYTDHSTLDVLHGQLAYSFLAGSKSYHMRLGDIQVDDGLWHQAVIDLGDGRSTRLSLDYGKYSAMLPVTESQTTFNFVLGAAISSAAATGVKSNFKGCMHSAFLGSDMLSLDPSGATTDSAVTASALQISSSPQNIGRGCLSAAVCAAYPCSRHATCIDEWEQYRCECPPFFSGRKCLDVCYQDRCLHNGKCHHSAHDLDNITCDCSGSFPYSRGPSGLCDRIFPDSVKLSCPTGFYDYPNCVPCRCDWTGAAGAVCTDTGICLCKDGTFSPANDKGCQPCNCHVHGSVASECDRSTGQCRCKPFTTGRRCDQCMDDYTGLDADGCHVLTRVVAEVSLLGPSTSQALRTESQQTRTEIAYLIERFFVGFPGSQHVTVTSLSIVPGRTAKEGATPRLQVNFAVRSHAYTGGHEASINDIMAALTVGLSHSNMLEQYRIVPGFLQFQANCSDHPCYPDVQCQQINATVVSCGSCPVGFIGDGIQCRKDMAGCSSIKNVSEMQYSSIDKDYDGVLDSCDNCPWVYNPDQSALLCSNAKSARCPAGLETLPPHTVVWRTGRPDHTLQQLCPGTSVGNMTRTCTEHGWQASNRSACQSLPIAALMNEFESLEAGHIFSAAEASQWMLRLQTAVRKATHSSSGSTPVVSDHTAATLPYPGDVKVVYHILNLMLQYGTSLMMSNLETLSEDFISTSLDVADVLFSGKQKAAWKLMDVSHQSTVAGLMVQLESFSMAHALSVAGDDAGVARQSHVLENMYVEYGMMSNGSSTFPTSSMSSNLSEFSISSNVPSGYAAFLQFDDAADLMNARVVKSAGEIASEWYLNSAVVMARFQATGSVPTSGFNGTVSFQLRRRNTAASGEAICAFWNPQLQQWSDSGCSMTAATVTHITCVCNHMTAFGVLERAALPVTRLTMHVLATASCAVSAVLFLVILALVIAYRKRSPAMLIVSYFGIAAGMFLLEVVFAVGLFSWDLSSVTCTSVAAILQYLLLAVACNVFLLFLRVTVCGACPNEKSRLSLYSPVSLVLFTVVFGYIAPTAVPVLCNALLYSHDFGNTYFCWISRHASGDSLWLFYVPPAALCTVTFILAMGLAGASRNATHQARWNTVWMIVFCLGFGCAFLLLPYFMAEYPQSRAPVVLFAITNVIWSFVLILLLVRMHRQNRRYHVKNDFDARPAVQKYTSEPKQSILNPPSALPAAAPLSEQHFVPMPHTTNSGSSHSRRSHSSHRTPPPVWYLVEGTSGGITASKHSAHTTTGSAASSALAAAAEYVSPYSLPPPPARVPTPPRISDFPTNPQDKQRPKQQQPRRNSAPRRRQEGRTVFTTLAVLDASTRSSPAPTMSDMPKSGDNSTPVEDKDTTLLSEAENEPDLEDACATLSGSAVAQLGITCGNLLQSSISQDDGEQSDNGGACAAALVDTETVHASANLSPELPSTEVNEDSEEEVVEEIGSDLPDHGTVTTAATATTPASASASAAAAAALAVGALAVDGYRGDSQDQGVGMHVSDGARDAQWDATFAAEGICSSVGRGVGGVDDAGSFNLRSGQSTSEKMLKASDGFGSDETLKAEDKKKVLSSTASANRESSSTTSSASVRPRASPTRECTPSDRVNSSTDTGPQVAMVPDSQVAMVPDSQVAMVPDSSFMKATGGLSDPSYVTSSHAAAVHGGMGNEQDVLDDGDEDTEMDDVLTDLRSHTVRQQQRRRRRRRRAKVLNTAVTATTTTTAA
eukprot:scpid1780/ scgid2551/ Cadherin EGF LAG seven-pass G-type receptor 2; Cadherin family member 10; Epidermal growth factor-like protein 2; Flamingo homolog 3; Multiple epidermal growth factor-like domains protein 3